MWSIRYVQVSKCDALAGLHDSMGALLRTSLSEDSSVLSGQESEEPTRTATGAQSSVPAGAGSMDCCEELPLGGIVSTTAVSTVPGIVDNDLLTADVFDPDKDRDSCEDIREKLGSGIKQSLSGETTDCAPTGVSSDIPAEDKPNSNTKGVIRRQRALSSNASSTSATEKDSLSAKPGASAEAKKVKRKSDIPPSASGRDGRGHRFDPSSSESALIRGSKSETSLSFDAEESFEVVSESELANVRRMEEEEDGHRMSDGDALVAAHQLKEGHLWQRRIVFRGKLTMHTAYDRKDNAEPASITSIAVSK